MTGVAGMQPRAQVDLPVVHMHKSRNANAMPARNPRPDKPRNLTGLYLGGGAENRDVADAPNGRRSVPLPTPMMTRARTMPSQRCRTPTEERSYYDPADYCSPPAINTGPTYAQYCPPTIVAFIHHNGPVFPACHNVPHFPPMPPSRYPLVPPQNKVEMLRVKEDKRGFSGNPVKQRRVPAAPEGDSEQPAPPSTQRSDTHIWDLTKQTMRQFTLSNNNGQSHLEYLAPDPKGEIATRYPHAFREDLQATLVNEVHQASEKQRDLAGLLHCYHKICKGDKDALQQLLPQKTAPPGQISCRTTGFSVKSYRLPHKAELLGQFPSPTDIGQSRTLHSRRPLVPSPYFFKTRNPTRTAGSMLERIVAPTGQSQYSSHMMSRSRPEPSRQNTPRESVRSYHQGAPHQPLTTSAIDMSLVAPLGSPRHILPTDHPRPLAADADHTEKVEISVPTVPKNEASEPPSPTTKDADFTDAIQAEGSHSNTASAEQSPGNQDGNQGNKTADGSNNEKSVQNGNADNNGNADSTNTNADINNTNADNKSANADANNDNADGGQDKVAQSVVTQADTAGSDPKASNSNPEIVVAKVDDTDSAAAVNDPFTGSGPKEGHNIQIVIRASNRKEEISELLNEHADIVQQISTAEKAELAAGSPEVPAEASPQESSETVDDSQQQNVITESSVENSKTADHSEQVDS